jgi:hypothetical protein
MTAPNLLNDDGTASIATMLMTAHHALRPALRRFAGALAQLGAGDHSRVDAWGTAEAGAAHTSIPDL